MVSADMVVVVMMMVIGIEVVVVLELVVILEVVVVLNVAVVLVRVVVPEGVVFHYHSSTTQRSTHVWRLALPATDPIPLTTFGIFFAAGFLV